MNTREQQRMGEGDCVEAAKLLYEYLDGEITPNRRQQIKGHLDLCPPCFDAFDFEVELRLVVAQRCREEVPDHLRQRVYKALEQLSDET